MSSVPPHPETVDQQLGGERRIVDEKVSTRIRVTCSHDRNGRIIVISADGTSNEFGEKNTYVLEFFSRIFRGEKQLTFYISGIGTHTTTKISRLIDMALAISFERNLLLAYKWLAENYNPGDRIFLFGFSRGAYQVRVIAGMIERIGLIYPGYSSQLPAVFKLYMSTTERSTDVGTDKHRKAINLCETFKKAFAQPDVRVHFVGVWDTVSSIGLRMGDSLPETVNGMAHVCHFRHALALDERRVKFWPEHASSTTPSHDEEKSQGDIKEVWFAGSHSDIGGGNVDNSELRVFGPALRWMTYEAMNHGLHMHSYTGTWELAQPTKSLTAVWQILELLPLRHPSHEGGHGTRMPHFGAPRRIQTNQRIHESVFTLMGIGEDVAALGIKRSKPDDEEFLLLGRIALDLFDTSSPRLASDSSQYQAWKVILMTICTMFYAGILRSFYAVTRSMSASSTGCDKLAIDNARTKAYVPSAALPDGNSWGDYWLLAGLMERDPFTNLSSTISRIEGATQGGDLAQLQSEVSVLTSISSNMGPGIKEPLTEVPDVLSKLLSAVQFLSTQDGARDPDIVTLFSALALLPSDPDHKLHLSAFRAIAQRVHGTSKFYRQLALLHANGFAEGSYESHKGHCIIAVAIPATGKILSACDAKVVVRSDGAERSIDISTQWRVSFQADGSQFATGNADGTVKIWDIKTETELRTFKGHSSPICSLTFSPDGSKIAAGSRDGTIRVWNTETGRDLFGAMEGHTGPVFGLAFSPDGTRLASGSFDSTVRLWDEAGKSRLLEGHRGPVWSVAFSKDYIISGSDDKTIRVWDAGSGGLVRVLRGHAGTVFCVAFSPDFKLVASGSDDWTARLWDVSSGEVLAIYDVGDVVCSIAFSFDGKQVVTGSYKGEVHIWNADVLL